MKESRYKLQKIFSYPKNWSEKDLQHYTKGDITASDRFDLENAAIDDPFLADALEGFQENNYQFEKSQPYQNVNNFLSKMEVAEEAKIVQMQPKSRLRWLAVAASVAILLAFGTFLFNGNNATSDADLVATYYAPFDADLPNFRGDVEEEIASLEIFNRGLSEYKKGEFAASLPFFEEFLRGDEDNPVANFYIGIAKFETGKVNEAINYFERSSTLKNGYAEQAKWYLALAHLQAGNRTEAKRVLTEYIATDAVYNKEAATALLKQL